MVNRTMPSASTSGAKPNVSVISALVAANGSGSRTMACQFMPSTFTLYSSQSSRLMWCQNLEKLRRLLSACLLRRRTLAWVRARRNLLYIRYWGLAWVLFTELPTRCVLGSWPRSARACYELWNFGQALLGSGCGRGGSSMGRTRTPVGTPGWLWVNLAAMGFSL